MIIVIGRGHSGTRIIPQILIQNGVYITIMNGENRCY